MQQVHKGNLDYSLCMLLEDLRASYNVILKESFSFFNAFLGTKCPLERYELHIGCAANVGPSALFDKCLILPINFRHSLRM